MDDTPETGSFMETFTDLSNNLVTNNQQQLVVSSQIIFIFSLLIITIIYFKSIKAHNCFNFFGY